MRRVFGFLFLFLIVMFSYSCDEQAPPLSDEELEAFMDANIEPSNLYGSWELAAILTEEPIDINGDGTEHNDLFMETNCFDGMRIEINENGSFRAVNSQMDFTANPGDLDYSCVNKSSDSGTWEIIGDKLILNMVIGNILIIDSKRIRLSDNGFALTVKRDQSANYVNHPENGLIRVVKLEYTRIN